MATAPPSNPQFASASLYVGDLAPDVPEQVLFDLFSAVGPVSSVRVCRDAATRRSLGYAYVNFHRPEDADRALDTMNFTLIRGRPCRIMWSHRDPSLRKSGTGNIFVKNLAKSIDNKMLYDTFSMFGNILSCKVATNDKGESLGYGFVHYETDEAALAAIEGVDGMIIMDEQVSVAPFRSKKERGGGERDKFTNVYVKNLPENVTEEQLNEAFARYGTITSSMLALDEQKKSRGFGFINFEQPEQAAAAVDALNGTTSFGGDRPLYVGRAQSKAEREKELRDRFEQVKMERQKKYAGTNLYVKNLSDTIDTDKLRELFQDCGNITSARVMMDGEKSRGFGFVCFSTPEEATKAVTEKNGLIVDGKPLYVSLAERKEIRRAKLEAQHSQRMKMGMAQPSMYPPNMFYAPGMAGPMPPRTMYPQMMPIPQVTAAAAAAAAANVPRGARGGYGMPGPAGRPTGPMMGMVHPASYGMMPMGAQQPPQGQQGQPQQQGPPRGPAPSRVRGQGHKKGGRGAGPAAQGQQQQQQPQQQQQQQQGFKYTNQVRNRQDGGMGASGPHGLPHQGMMPQGAVPVDPSQLIAPGMGMHPMAGGSNSLQALVSELQSTKDEQQKKQLIGERLYPLVSTKEPQQAGKITGMLLEMDNGELLHLLESPDALAEKVEEALAVLREHQQDLQVGDAEGEQ